MEQLLYGEWSYNFLFKNNELLCCLCIKVKFSDTINFKESKNFVEEVTSLQVKYLKSISESFSAS